MPDPLQPVTDALRAWLAHALRRAHGAWGVVPPAAKATVTGSTRLVLAISGRNWMRLPQGEAVSEVILRAGEVAVVHRLAWNLAPPRLPKVFLTLDLMPDYTRYYLRRHRRLGDPPDFDCHFAHGPPDPALRAAADAAEALAATGGELLAQAARLTAACALRQLDRPVMPSDPPWQRLRDWIEERLHDPDLSREAAATACGIHPGHVSRVVARVTGHGFAAWVARRRVARACDLLAGTALPACAIAGRCGFTRATYFAHAFRAVTGTSPGRWRAGRG